ncbi:MULTISPECIES: hypothetical protein [Mycobacteriaceae]|uniref:Uncharacterized protein n=1 Tax=Mycolicibacterium neoaurum VKM Ac-1815D TaxID=700508 RepID=V5XIW1_MYCNE|nr:MULTISPECIES: hypothetical protein [Mycobacteriaceae]AHC27813.1 hypothetical protein D174_04170 [Mycolicibacterium neoaurum VKM Ac-1815D]AMO04503.1 hypothetical protein MyAD_04085 [Mycolicibacterium neoaurum]AXK77209.1 hypothetical protein DXK33_21040 [Mycolicibacterium neoaurum]KJQ48526.1 hypothetical protein TS71_20665 [Mycolicibacterium neoaurum]KUM06912.1 hypothetical protein AVZ31_18835 [Mycolicibacterium neoaurum]
MDLVTLAEQATAAADLDGKSRDQFQWEMDFGDTEIALSIAVLDTRKPLPTKTLDEVAAGATRWYLNGTYRQLILDAVDRQQRQHRDGQP